MTTEGTTDGTEPADLEGALRRLSAVSVPPNVRTDLDLVLLWARQVGTFLTVIGGSAVALQLGPVAVDLAALA